MKVVTFSRNQFVSGQFNSIYWTDFFNNTKKLCRKIDVSLRCKLNDWFLCLIKLSCWDLVQINQSIYLPHYTYLRSIVSVMSLYEYYTVHKPSMTHFCKLKVVITTKFSFVIRGSSDELGMFFSKTSSSCTI